MTLFKSTRLFIFIFMLGLTIRVMAQDRPHPGGERPTRTAPDFQATPRSGAENPTFTVPAIPTLSTEGFQKPAGWESFSMPDDWSQFTLPTEAPASAEELKSLLDQLPAEFEIPAEEIATPESSPEAYAAITGFASTYLDVGVAPIYAGVVTGESAQSVSTIESSSIDQIMAQFPPEVQSMLATASQASGIAYWAILSDGTALIYIGECIGENCAVSIQNIQFHVINGSLGAYALYRSGTATSTEQALSMIASTYPAFAGKSMVAVEVEQGYAFTATGFDANSPTIQVIYTGVFSLNGQSVVYAVIGIGEGYAEIVR